MASGCENDVIKTQPSPDAVQRLVVFTRDCGATSEASTQVSIIASTGDVVGTGNVLIIDSDHGKAPTTDGGFVEVDAKWVDRFDVSVEYPASSRVFRRAERVGPIVVHFSAQQ